MLLSLDFGITITDVLRKKEAGALVHEMFPSDQKSSEKLIKTLFKGIPPVNLLNIGFLGI